VTATRFAYLLKRFPRLSETFVLNEMLELQRQGIALRVYALADPRETQIDPEAARLRPQVIYLHDPHQRIRSWCRLMGGAGLQALQHPLGALRVVWALATVHRSLPSLRHAIEGLWLARDLRRHGVQHLHAHFIHSPAAVAYLAFLSGGPPFSVTAHAKDLYTTLPRNLRIRAGAARFVITCTRSNAAHLAGVVPAAAQVFYHGTDLQRFTPDRSKVEPNRILSVGRLVPKKGFEDLVDALALLQKKGLPIRADVYGGGPLRDALEARADRLGLNGALKFHGARLQDEIVAAYRQAAVFVLAPVVTDDGDRDGIPNVLVEAMASGVPVVATRISGIPELITDGVDGLLVDERDPAALGRAIERLWRDDELAAQLGRAARHRVERDFDLVENTRRLRAFFEGVPVHDHRREAAA
jgi:glycosyltransferase involved in cell wall biosynthesis